jgi:8-oxo-dGTP pyrophosphatase MutT (NUDIX family)
VPVKVQVVTERTLVGLGADPSELVLAAGGLVLRLGAGGSVEIALVHRPLREDWSFPKGKAEPAETLTECALREVLEETGLRCRIVAFVGTTEYMDRRDRPKIVAYWAMAPLGGAFRPSQEVEELRWVDLGSAPRELSYQRDRELLDRLTEVGASIFPQLLGEL